MTYSAHIKLDDETGEFYLANRSAINLSTIVMKELRTLMREWGWKKEGE